MVDNIVFMIYYNLRNNKTNKSEVRNITKGVTERVGRYLKENKVNLSELSRETEIPYNLLYASVWDKNRIRELRVDEFFSICEVLGASPEIFAPDAKDGG